MRKALVVTHIIAAVLLGAPNLSSAQEIPMRIRHVRAFGGTGVDVARDVAVDATGNVFITGSFQGTVDFGTGPLSSFGGRDIFLVKLDRNLNSIWSKHAGGVEDDEGLGLATNAAGDVVVTGSFRATATFDGAAQTSVGDVDCFIWQLGPTGATQWLVQRGDVGLDAGVDVAVDKDGNIIVACTRWALPIRFAQTIKYRPDHVREWLIERRGMPVGVAVGDNGDVASILSGGDNGLFAVKCTAAGSSYLWSYGGDGANDVFFRGNDSYYVGRYGIHSLGAPRFDSRLQTGDCQGGGAWSDGGLLTAGSFSGTLSDWEGNKLLSSNANSIDPFVVNYWPDASIRGKMRFGGPGDDRILRIAVSPLGDLFAVGEFRGVCDFDGQSRTSAGDADAFVAAIASNDPSIIAVQDVGNDQGGWVKATFFRSVFDYAGAPSAVTEYEVFRRDGPEASPTWTSVARVPAHREQAYRVIVPTLIDAPTPVVRNSFFFVRAKTAVPALFFDSLPGSGYSLDNLAPKVPAQLAYNNGLITWSAQPDRDLAFFTVYGSETSAWSDAAVPLGRAEATFLDVTANSYPFYFVTATDRSGNESEAAGVSGPESASRPLDLTAFPNPFNPATTIRYVLPQRSHVTLSIYDARGMRVATLVDEVRAAGLNSVKWNGQDAGGRLVASGVYLVQLRSDTGTRLRKIVLMK